MTIEHVSAPSEPLTTAPAPFGADEIHDLDREDVQAGRVIAWLLCFFFLYTIVGMSLAAWWTWDSIG